VREAAASQYCAVPFHTPHRLTPEAGPPACDLRTCTTHPAAEKEPLFSWAMATDDCFVPEKPHLALESRSCPRLGTRGLQQPWPISCRNLSTSSHLLRPPLPSALSEVVGTLARQQHGRGRRPIPLLLQMLQIVPAAYTGRAAEWLSRNPSIVCPPFPGPSSRHIITPPQHDNVAFFPRQNSQRRFGWLDVTVPPLQHGLDPPSRLPLRSLADSAAITIAGSSNRV